MFFPTEHSLEIPLEGNVILFSWPKLITEFQVKFLGAATGKGKQQYVGNNKHKQVLILFLNYCQVSDL